VAQTREHQVEPVPFADEPAEAEQEVLSAGGCGETEAPPRDLALAWVERAERLGVDRVREHQQALCARAVRHRHSAQHLAHHADEVRVSEDVPLEAARKRGE
jgi:hypothetical protein